MIKRAGELTKHLRSDKLWLTSCGYPVRQLSLQRKFNHFVPLVPGTISTRRYTSKIEEIKPAVGTKDAATVGKDTQKQLEINTNSGKLLVKATTGGDEKLQTVIIERASDSDTPKVAAVTTPCEDKSDDEVKEALEKELKIKIETPTIIPSVVSKRIRTKTDYSHASLERNFITPVRAMSDFLLTMADLEELPKTKRRSPYEQEPPITVYWRKDVEAKAIQVWGTRENLLKECLKREIERKMHQQNIFTVKRRLRDYRREIGNRTKSVDHDEDAGLFGSSGKVVLTAIGINAANFIFKFGAWIYTGSHSMFAECIHSLADTLNQCILAYGIHKSTQIADSDHPYGYTNMKYVSSLISGVGIFCVGTGLSFYHGITGLIHPEPIHDIFWGLLILGGSLVSEGATLLVALNRIRIGARKMNCSFREYVMRGQDPCVNVVLTEDTAAVLSVALAASCMGLSALTGSPYPDAVGSLLVGGMLGAVASFIIYQNVAALVGRSIPHENLDKINAELESDIMIRAIHDVKGIDMGNTLVRYKAEMDFDGRELTRVYLDKLDLNVLLEVI